VSEQVAARLRDEIRARGPIPFADFMREALYGPGGFYEGTPVGSRGHFVTSPHVHPVFSRLLGGALEALWSELGRPAPFRLVEVGAGDGTMGRELVDGFARAGIDLDYVAVETSPGARQALAAVTPSVAGGLAEVGPLDPGVVVANELLDNLPFHRIRRRGGEVLEVRVGLDADRFVEVETPCPAELSATTPSGDATELVVPTGALAFVDELAVSLRMGYALLIDYAPAGEVHAYRAHRVVADVLDDPGSADITAGVDLEALAARARAWGLEAFEPVAQGAALTALGFDDWVRAELSRQGDLLNTARGSDAVRTWEGRNRARLLVDPSALGRLRWLVLATSGLPAPWWLLDARAAAGDGGA
jgi:NADH dehydrogenase [ubiquinone] 1 alpha subcomplex assembly factor 7